MTSPSATQDRYPYQNEPIWSRSEKTVARAAFDAALKRELQEVMQEAKQMATQINEPAALWDLEHHLTQRRKEIDRKYEYKYPQLTQVFGRLLHEQRLREEDLLGFAGGQAEVDPFIRHILVSGRSVT
jgi:hypothetical protein